jgi:RNA polymerase sigma-70 factor, ECF subfamily
MTELEHTETSLLINLSREGDAAAIEKLVHTHESRIFRLALSMLDDPAEADEATQETFITALRRLNTYRGEASFVTWLYAIGLNVCRGRLRKRRARERLSDLLQGLLRSNAGGELHPEQAVIEQETDRAVWQALQTLNEKQREVIILRFYHDLKLDDIARVAGVSERTVRTWLQQAQEQLRVKLKGKLE